MANNISGYKQELMAANAFHQNMEVAGFRSTDVFCTDKFNRKITFSKPADIKSGIDQLLTLFATEFEKAVDVPALALCFARFFYVFISIHPYEDANRRTAFTFLERRAKEKSYEIYSIDLLRRVLLEGAVTEEMQKLRSLFIKILKPQQQGA